MFIPISISIIHIYIDDNDMSLVECERCLNRLIDEINHLPKAAERTAIER